jgi:signal transduction histidine kinase
VRSARLQESTRIAREIHDVLYRAGSDATAELTIDGDRERLAGPAGHAVLRVVQEALTNVRKHAPGAAVAVAVHAGTGSSDEIVAVVQDRPTAEALARQGAGSPSLSLTGGGYGLEGMRERARGLGGTLSAGAGDDGWRVELRLPAPKARSELDAMNGSGSPVGPQDAA